MTTVDDGMPRDVRQSGDRAHDRDAGWKLTPARGFEPGLPSARRGPLSGPSGPGGTPQRRRRSARATGGQGTRAHRRTRGRCLGDEAAQPTQHTLDASHFFTRHPCGGCTTGRLGSPNTRPMVVGQRARSTQHPSLTQAASPNAHPTPVRCRTSNPDISLFPRESQRV